MAFNKGFKKKQKPKESHLADYIFWDAERQTEFIKEHLGWKEDHVEGTYKKYKSVECIMPGVHDYSKYLKRGFAEVLILHPRMLELGFLIWMK